MSEKGRANSGYRLGEAWDSAIAAMRDNGSIEEILALYESGAITGQEILGGAWEQCHDQPSLQAKLSRDFRNCSDDYIASTVGGGLDELAAQAEHKRHHGNAQ